MKISMNQALIVGLLLCIVPTEAPAATITLNFIGVVTFVGDPFGLVGSQVTAGDPVTASLRYETVAADWYPDDPTRGTYFTGGWLKLDINGLTFEQTSSVHIDILHHGNGDQELFSTLISTGDFGTPNVWPASLPLFEFFGMGFGIGQTELPYTLLTSDALPVSLDLALADFANGEVGSSTSDRSMYDIHFRLTAVPEPTSLALIGAGGLSVLLNRRRRRNR